METVRRKDILHREKQTGVDILWSSALNTMSPHVFTSHMCPTIGASAQECSAFIPIFPFGYEISVKDLSNHLWGERKQWKENINSFINAAVSYRELRRISLLTCHNTFHGAGIWHNCPVSRTLWGHNPAARRLVSGRRRLTQWHPGTLCLLLGWNI